MENEKIIEGIMVKLQKKYNYMNEVFKTTGEMAQALGRNDDVSFEMLVFMRQETMEKIDAIDKEAMVLLLQLPDEMQRRIEEIKEKGIKAFPNLQGKEKIMAEITDRVKAMVQKIIEMDKVLNKKVNQLK